MTETDRQTNRERERDRGHGNFFDRSRLIMSENTPINFKSVKGKIKTGLVYFVGTQ